MISPVSDGAEFCDLVCDLLAAGVSVRFRVEGRSMQPTIFPGDCLIIEPEHPAAAQPGDVWLYRRGDRLLAHRIVGVDPSGSLILQGDTPGSLPDHVPRDCLLGRAASTTPRRADASPVAAFRERLLRRAHRIARRSRG